MYSIDRPFGRDREDIGSGERGGESSDGIAGAVRQAVRVLACRGGDCDARDNPRPATEVYERVRANVGVTRSELRRIITVAQ